MALEQQIAALAAQASALTTEVTGKMGAIDAKVAQAEIDFANLTPEKRITNTITIGGSADYLYPVWWRFPNLSLRDVGKLSIRRHYNTNAADPIGGLIGMQNHAHVYGLLCEIEGLGHLWAGVPAFMQIKRFGEGYDVGMSHLQFGMHIDPALSSEPMALAYSGCYLRGGGLTYSFDSNWNINLQHQDGSLGVNAVTEIYNYLTYHWSVKPIPLGAKNPATGLYPNILTPVADLLPY